MTTNSERISINSIKASLSNISLPWLIFTLVIFTGLIKLGLWQSSRAYEKEQRLAKIEDLKQQQSLSLQQILALETQQNDPHYINDFPIHIKGNILPDYVFLLDNQTNKGSLGYKVYQVVESTPYKVLVNLGWVQGSIDRNKLPDVNPLNGTISFTGHIRYIEEGIMLMNQNFDNASWPLRVQQIELDKFSALIDDQLLPFVVYLDKNEVLGYDKNWQPIVMPPEKHRAYAFQWFSLAIAWLMLMAWASYKFSHIADDKESNKEK